MGRTISYNGKSVNTQEKPALEQLASQHTASLNEILQKLGISLLVTTYQAGKLIVVRSEGEKINTRFTDFKQPMGLARGKDKFALGAKGTIIQFRSVPNNATKVQKDGFAHDGCYQHMSTHITGDIDIHEMGYDKDDRLWFINTKFSCLCTREGDDSFTPKWRPPFISGYDNLDRCHLNGLGFENGVPRYVTSLGISDEPLGWRKNKAFGGMLMDISDNTMLLEGLSMPHSPRVYRGKLWFLESGRGSLSYYDFTTKKVTQVAELPGFTRGIDFVGNLAFIGLSKVRESATFGAIPLTQKDIERVCGVWAVDINSGKILGFIRFTAGVQEIFAVTALPQKFPEILPLDHQLVNTTYIIPQTALEEYKPPENPVELAAPHFEKGNDLYNEGKKELARQQYEKALAIQKDHIPARFNLGVTLHDLGYLNEAEKELQTVINNESQYFEAYYMLGQVHDKRQDAVKAKEMYQKSLTINPAFRKAQIALEAL